MPQQQTDGGHLERHERGRHRVMKRLGFGSRNLVLDRDMRAKALRVLPRQMPEPEPCEILPEPGQGGALDGIGRALPQEPQRRHRHCKGRSLRRLRGEHIADLPVLSARQMMEQGEMRRDQIALRRKMLPPLPVETRKARRIEAQCQDQRRVIHGVDRPGTQGFLPRQPRRHARRAVEGTRLRYPSPRLSYHSA